MNFLPLIILILTKKLNISLTKMLKKLSVLLILFLPDFSFSKDPLVNSRVFIENLGKEVIASVADESLDDKIRQENFRKLYNSAFDNKYISKFVLGRHWKKIDKKTKEIFFRSFNDYLVMVYAPKFKGWNGTFKTTKSSLIKKNLYLVEMKLVNTKGSSSLKLDWRMYLNANNKFKILDVNIDGVSMLVTQRAEFISVIKNNPNGVMGLIEKMKTKTKS